MSLRGTGYDGSKPLVVSKLVGLFGSMAITLAFSVLLLFVEPKEISQPTDRLSFALFTTLFSGLVYDGGIENEIGVVLLNQESLTSLEQSWPPAYSVHAGVLETLLAYRPRAVFIDFLLVDERGDPTIGELARILKAYKTLGIPVYISAGNARDYYGREVLPALRDLVVPVAGWTSGLDRTGLTYDLLPRRPSGSQADRLPSAALRMYRDACNSGSGGDFHCREIPDTLADQRDMWVMWPRRLPALGQAFDQHPESAGRLFDCEMAASDLSLPTRVIALPISLVDPGVTTAATCGPHLALSAHDVIFRSPEAGRPYAAAFADRFVFYGFDLQGFQDVVHPPTTRNAIPGVFAHAAAFENLLLWGPRYLSSVAAPTALRWVNGDRVEVLSLAVVLLFHYALVIVVWLWTRKVPLDSDDVAGEGYGPQGLMETAVAVMWRGLFVVSALLRSLTSPSAIGILLLLGAEVAVILSFLFGTSFLIEYRLLGLAPVNWIAILSIFGLNLLLSARLLWRRVAAAQRIRASS